MRNLKKHLSVLLVLVMVFTMLAPVFAVSSFNYEDEANYLHELGLYQGIDPKHFVPDLGSNLTREQAATLLLRVFGQEQDAEALTDAQVNEALAKFDDANEVSAWARKSVAYAAQQGIVNGIPTGNGLIFNPNGSLKGIEYATLILRELGLGPDEFDYFGSLEKLVSLDVISVQQMMTFESRELIRDDVVAISYNVLTAQAKNGSTVIENLIEKGAVNRSVAERLGLVEKQETPAEPSTEPSEEPTTEPTEEPVANAAKVEFVPAESRVLSRSQSLFEIGQVQITAAEEPVVVTGLKLQRTGISADTVVKSITVWNGNEKVNSIGRFSTGIANIAFTKVVTVPAGQTVKLPIRINVNNTAGIASELKISLLEVKSDTALAGNFPMVGNAFTIAEVDLGTLTVEKSGDAPAASLNAGDKNVRLAKFNFEVGSEAQTIKRIVFSQDGTAADTDLANLQLVDEDGTVLALGQLDRGELVFDLNKDCISGTTARLTVRGDVVGGAGRTIQFSIDNVNDVQSVGKIYGTTVVASGTAYGSKIEIDKGAFILTKASSSPAASTIAKTVDDQKFTAITVETIGEPIQMESITVGINEHIPGNTDTEKTFVREIKLVNNGVVIASQEVKKASDFANGLDLPLSEVVTVEPGSPSTIDILVDLRNADSDTDYKVGIVSIVGTGIVSGKDVTVPAKEEDEDGNVIEVEEEGTYGNTMTVGDVKITIEPAAEIDGYAFQNQASVALTEFDINHNLGDAVRLSSLTIGIKGEGVEVSDADVQKTFKNFRLVSSNGTVVSETIVNPKSTTLKIALKEGLVVEAGKTLKLRLLADIRTSAKPNSKFVIETKGASAVTISTGTKVEIDEAIASSRTITIAEGAKASDVTASFSIENELKDKNIVAGSNSEVEVARWTLENKSNEAVKVNKVYLTAKYAGQIEDLKSPYVKYILKAEGNSSTTQLTDTFTIADGIAKEVKILKDSNDSSKLVIDEMKDGENGKVELVLYAKVADGAQIGGTVSVALGKAIKATEKDTSGNDIPLDYNSKVDLYEITGKESGLTELVSDVYVKADSAANPAIEEHKPELLQPGKNFLEITNTVALAKVDLSAHSSGTTREKATTGSGENQSTSNATVANFTIKNEGTKTVGVRQIALKLTDKGEGITKLDLYSGGSKLALATPEKASGGLGADYEEGKYVIADGKGINESKEGYVVFNIREEEIKLKGGETVKFEVKAPEDLKAGESVTLSLDRELTFIDKPDFKGYKITLDRNNNDEDKVLVPLGTYTVETK